MLSPNELEEQIRKNYEYSIKYSTPICVDFQTSLEGQILLAAKRGSVFVDIECNELESDYVKDYVYKHEKLTMICTGGDYFGGHIGIRVSFSHVVNK